MSYHLEKGSADFNTIEFRKLINVRNNQLKKEGIPGGRFAVYEEIGEACNIGPETLRHWYKGDNSPNSVDKIEDIAKFFEADLDTLFVYQEVYQSEKNLKYSQTELDKFKSNILSELEKCRSEIEEMKTLIQKDTKWYIRDVYQDLYRIITDYLYEEGEVNTWLYSEWRHDSGNPYDAIVTKIEKYNLDLPQPAIDGLNDLLDYLFEILFYREAKEFPDTYDEERIESLRGKEYGQSDLDYYDFARAWGYDPLSEDETEQKKLWYCFCDYYYYVKKTFLEMANEKLGKYFE